MPRTEVNGIELYYETTGDESDPPLLLICGLGMQMVSWGDDFGSAAASKGYFVITFDNRDAGLSSHLVELGVPDLAALLGGSDGNIGYHLEDMATDIAGLLDTLGLDSVHVMGISMGGMIAQQFAVDYPAKVRSLTSIMSTTGNPHVGQPSQAAAEALLQLNATTREEAVAMATTVFGIIGSPGFPPDEDRLRRLAGEAFDRNHEPTGMSRQLGAILGSPDRTSRLAEVRVPAVVIHGSADPLVNLSGGEATAAAIAGAKLVIIDGMGHDLPEQVWDEILGEVDAIARTAEARGAAASSPSS